MISKEQAKHEILNYFNVPEIQILKNDDLISHHVNFEKNNLVSMLLNIEEKYGFARTKADEKIVPPYREDLTMSNLIDWVYFHMNNLEIQHKLDTSKQLWGIYYASLEFARDKNDPLLGVVVAMDEKAAIECAMKEGVKDQGVGLHAVSLEYYKEQMNSSSEGGELKATYSFLVRQISDFWKSKYSSQNK